MQYLNAILYNLLNYSGFWNFSKVSEIVTEYIYELHFEYSSNLTSNYILKNDIYETLESEFIINNLDIESLNNYYCINTTDSVSVNASELVHKRHYYPFGMPMHGRKFNSPAYRYGFNGMEKDDEMGKGEGNSYDFGARLYDPRLGKWLAVDPLASKYPSLSPYNFVGNMPIIAIDPDGKRIVIKVKGEYNARPFILVAATKKGYSKLLRLEKKKDIWVSYRYSIEEVGYSHGLITYQPNKNGINYDGGDIWSNNSTTQFSHELIHGEDDFVFSRMYGEKGEYNFGLRYKSETRAGDFTNYIRSVYSMSFYRDKYNFVINDYNYDTDESYVNSENEKISNMVLLAPDIILFDSQYRTDYMTPSYNIADNQMVGVSFARTTSKNGTTSESLVYMLTYRSSNGVIRARQTNSLKKYNKWVNTLEKKGYNYSYEKKTNYTTPK